MRIMSGFLIINPARFLLGVNAVSFWNESEILKIFSIFLNPEEDGSKRFWAFQVLLVLIIPPMDVSLGACEITNNL